MSYSVKILADSIAPCGKRLTTFELTYPRFVHAELMTHRMFSRNSASSRAIPVPKLMERVRTDPVMPKFWGQNQKGMQAQEEMDSYRIAHAEEAWLHARDEMLRFVDTLHGLGVHKQLANRLIEPWMFITVIVSATEYENWFRLRDSPEAQPEIAWVARAMRSCMTESQPRELPAGAWHLPLWRHSDWGEVDGDFTAAKITTARCARVSYLTHDGRRDLGEDVAMYERLRTSGHWSPFEHAARALDTLNRIGNFIGWRQHRADVDPNYMG